MRHFYNDPLSHTLLRNIFSMHERTESQIKSHKENLITYRNMYSIFMVCNNGDAAHSMFKDLRNSQGYQAPIRHHALASRDFKVDP